MKPHFVAHLCSIADVHFLYVIPEAIPEVGVIGIHATDKGLAHTCSSYED